MIDAGFYILRVSTGAETAVAEAVSKRGVQSYVPVREYSVFVRKMRRVVKRIGPMVPGYVFVSCPYIGRTPIKDVFGYLRHADEALAFLSPKATATLRRAERSASMSDAVRAGSVVKFVAGSSAHVGKVTRATNTSLCIDINGLQIVFARDTMDLEVLAA